MKNLRILFMGTPEFAVTILQGLLSTSHDIVGVITAPDKPAGRGQKIKKSAVKLCAEEHNLKILQPTNLKNQDFLDDLRSLEVDLQIVVAFRMLPEAVWKMPQLGTFNLHASLLPQYRGAAPINWAIINGETKTGVSTFFIDEKIDTGAIILQDEIAIEPNESAGSLHDKLMHAGTNLVLKTVEAIAAGTVTTSIQPKEKELKTAYKLHNENTKIDWNQSFETIHNHIRGLNPYPGAWCYLDNNGETYRVKLYNAFAKAYSEDIPKQEAGLLTIHEGELLVHATNGVINVQEIQLPGKRKMPVKDLLNGYKFGKNAKMR